MNQKSQIGLPAEQFAIKTGHHPAEFTYKNIDNFRRQIKSLGFSYDWDRERTSTLLMVLRKRSKRSFQNLISTF